MNVANISYARNHLSELINRVREGESILITDRHVPVAQLDPPSRTGRAKHDWKNNLIRRGILCSAKNPLDTDALIAMAIPTPKSEGDILAALTADREESR